MTTEVATYKGMYAANMYSPAENSPHNVLRDRCQVRETRNFRLQTDFLGGSSSSTPQGFNSGPLCGHVSCNSVFSALSESF